MLTIRVHVVGFLRCIRHGRKFPIALFMTIFPKTAFHPISPRGESDRILPNGVLFFESVGRIPNVSECDRSNDRALFLQSFTWSYSFFSLSENEHWNFCQILTFWVLKLWLFLGIKTKLV